MGLQRVQCGLLWQWPLLGVARNQRGHKDARHSKEFGVYSEDEGRGGKGKGSSFFVFS